MSYKMQPQLNSYGCVSLVNLRQFTVITCCLSTGPQGHPPHPLNKRSIYSTIISSQNTFVTSLNGPQRPVGGSSLGPRLGVRRPQPPPAVNFIDLAEALYASEGQVFEPVFDPNIGIAALVAAIPPIIFWARVVLAEQRRKRELEEKEKARLELKRKLFGNER